MKYNGHTSGQWYLREDTQEMFQVIDDDEQSGTIRVQLFDGSLDEIEAESWRALSPVPVAPPDDWTGPLDLETSDFEEWAEEERDSPINVFRDEREPWHDIVVQELSQPGPEEEEEAWTSPSVEARLGQAGRIKPPPTVVDLIKRGRRELTLTRRPPVRSLMEG
jgi:hypothetical protein